MATEPTLPIDSVHAFVGPPELLASGDPSGPLAGATLAVKDVIDVAGRVTGAGNPDLARVRAPAGRSAPVVDALVDAGVTVVGKTVTDELAYSLGGDNVHFQEPVNVAAPGRTTGGSSSGSAAAVAAGLVDLALGTDTGGSVRVPAGYCGILGWRPTHGAVSVEGVTPLSPSFDTVGLLARSADLLRAGARAMLATTAGGRTRIGGRTPTTPPMRLVSELVDALDPAVADLLDAEIVGRFGELPERVEIGVDLATCLNAFRTLQGAEAWAEHGAWITTAAPNLGAATAARFRSASEVTPEQVASARQVRDRVRAAVEATTRDGTVLVAPAAAGFAPIRAVTGPDPERVRTDTLRLTTVAGLAGAPVVVVPGPEAPGGHRGSAPPLGVALMGAPGDDLRLLDLVS